MIAFAVCFCVLCVVGSNCEASRAGTASVLGAVAHVACACERTLASHSAVIGLSAWWACSAASVGASCWLVWCCVLSVAHAAVCFCVLCVVGSKCDGAAASEPLVSVGLAVYGIWNIPAIAAACCLLSTYLFGDDLLSVIPNCAEVTAWPSISRSAASFDTPPHVTSSGSRFCFGACFFGVSVAILLARHAHVVVSNNLYVVVV